MFEFQRVCLWLKADSFCYAHFCPKGRHQRNPCEALNPRKSISRTRAANCDCFGQRKEKRPGGKPPGLSHDSEDCAIVQMTTAEEVSSPRRRAQSTHPRRTGDHLTPKKSRLSRLLSSHEFLKLTADADPPTRRRRFRPLRPLPQNPAESRETCRRPAI